MPRAVKKLRGTLQPCRDNPDEPTPDFVVRVEPTLPITGLALEQFEGLVEDVGSLGCLHKEHRRKLTNAAIALAASWEAAGAGKWGDWVRLDNSFRQLVSGFGLCPATMTKVAAKKGPDEEADGRGMAVKRKLGLVG